MIIDFFVLAPVILVFRAVFQQHTMQLLYMIFGRRDRFVAIKNHIHGIGIARHFLLVAGSKRFCLQPGKQFFHFCIAELSALDTSG